MRSSLRNYVEGGTPTALGRGGPSALILTSKTHRAFRAVSAADFAHSEVRRDTDGTFIDAAYGKSASGAGRCMGSAARRALHEDERGGKTFHRWRVSARAAVSKTRESPSMSWSSE